MLPGLLMQFSFRRSNVIIRRERKVPRPPDPSVPWFGPARSESSGRLVPFFLSLGLHLSLVTAVFVENYLRPPLELQAVSVDQLLQDGRYEITWPVRPADLPPVKPAEPPKPRAEPPPGDGAPPRFRLPQQVLANDPSAASSRQMIWDEAPQVEINRDVPSPNFVEPPRLEVEQPRFELAEPKLVAPARETIAAETAPRLQTAAPVSPDVLARNPRLRYWAQETEAAAPQRNALAAGAAPVIVSGPLGGLDLDQIQQRARLRFWTPEQEAVEPGRQALGPVGSAPQIVSGPVGGIDVAQFQRLSRLRYQQADGTAGPGPAPERRALADDAGRAPDVAAGSSSVGVANDAVLQQTLASLGEVGPPRTGRAVVGVDPTQDPSSAVPRGRRGGNFSAGPDGSVNGSGVPGSGSGDGAAGDNGTLAAVRIPHLSVTPASPGAATGLSDGRPPEPGAPSTDRESVLQQFRNADFSPVPNIGVVAQRETPDPEFPFPGRAVYTLAVNMPNISSYSGSWIIEFAEVKNAGAVEGGLQPPSPRLKVDPVYPPAVIEERIEGDVVLHAVIRSDGLVDHIQVIKRLDGRLDESAKAALAKWRFNPATKNGVPVDIETVVRIPFRLTPRDDKRR